MRRLVWCLGIWVALATGCGSDDESAAQIWCEGVCAAVARCGSNAGSCTTNCVRQTTGLAGQSASGATAQKPCLAQLSCQAVGGDQTAWEQEQKACWEQAIMSVAVSDRVRRFCPDHALSWFECGYVMSLDDCEHIYSMWNDAIVNRLALCDAKESCDEFESCEQNVFDSL
jgi:hypothetical protein